MKVKIAAPSASTAVIKSAEGIETKAPRPKNKKNKTVHQPAIVLGIFIVHSPLVKRLIGRIANPNRITPVRFDGREVELYIIFAPTKSNK
jgi:hypothetical protein